MHISSDIVSKNKKLGYWLDSGTSMNGFCDEPAQPSPDGGKTFFVNKSHAAAMAEIYKNIQKHCFNMFQSSSLFLAWRTKAACSAITSFAHIHVDKFRKLLQGQSTLQHLLGLQVHLKVFEPQWNC